MEQNLKLAGRTGLAERRERLYLCLLAKTFKQQFVYRSDLFFRTLGGILRLYIQVCIWTALLAQGAAEVTLTEMVTYIVVASLLTGLTHSTISYTLAERVRQGTIALDLIRPVDLRTYLLCTQLSENLFSLLFSSLPVVSVAVLVWGVIWPTLPNLLLFLLSTGLAVLLMFLIEYAIGLLVFWVKDGVYTDFLIHGLFTIFSGTTIPLWFYPEFLAKIAYRLPFRLITFEPISIYLGRYQWEKSLQVIIWQCFWIVLFFLLAVLIWRKIQKSIFIQGG